jgi:hypothetical protein
MQVGGLVRRLQKWAAWWPDSSSQRTMALRSNASGEHLVHLSGEVMAICPHCGQEIQFVQSGKRSVLTRNLTPGLGCGSLIAIAIIVYIFSRGHSENIERMDANVRSLENKVEALTTSVNELAKQRKQ